MDDPLRTHWDFADLDATEQRFRRLLTAETTGAPRAELMTQLARIAGLRGRFSEADAVLDEASAFAGESGLARARVSLERGRVRRSGGDPTAALDLFVAAWHEARAAGNAFVAVDAAHMAALSAATPPDALAWTERGIALARDRPEDAGYWLGPLLNNLGWTQLEAGDAEAALSTFEAALAAREQFPEQRAEIEIARYAVARALRTLGRAADAAERLELAVAWAEEAGAPDGWFHEELAHAYADLGRAAEGRQQATRALELLPEQDAEWDDGGERAGRLRSLL